MATTAPRKRAPKKAAPKPSPATQWDDGLEPVRIGQRPETVEMRTLFLIDDVEYKVPAKLDPRLGLRYLREARDPSVGAVEALARVTVDFLGEDNLRALEESPGLTQQDVTDVLTIAQRIVLGQAKAAGNPS